MKDTPLRVAWPPSIFNLTPITLRSWFVKQLLSLAIIPSALKTLCFSMVYARRSPS